uniref:Immunoglobulin V-set domain-containing protein n=1 Tax=Nothobranchius furzeri TaxID=105023 RepID=A0A8C6PIY2_NOTFU
LLPPSRLLFLLHLEGIKVQIHQTPSALIRKVGEDVQLVCSHGHIDYRVMLWYQWLAGDLALKLIGYGYSEFRNDSVEETFRKSRFSLAGDLSGNKNRSGSLFIKNLSPQEHTATYFCAARKAQYTKHPPAPHKNHLPADCLTLAHEIPSYDTVLWYQRSPGDTALKLVAYIYYKIPKVEPPFESHFKVSGDGEKKAHLHILNLTHSEDSGDYFGAASLHGDKESDFLIQKPQ